MVQKLKRDAGLQEEVKNCIVSMLPVVAAMAGGTQAGITDAQMKQMTAYLEKLQAGGSVNLQKDLTELLSTFKNRGFLPELKLIQQ